jgi:hypothetical protein
MNDQTQHTDMTDPDSDHTQTRTQHTDQTQHTDSDHTQTQTPKHTDLRSWIKEENVETG